MKKLLCNAVVLVVAAKTNPPAVITFLMHASNLLLVLKTLKRQADEK